MEKSKNCFFIQYRTPHFGLYEPDKDILQVHVLPYSEAVRIKEAGEEVTTKPILYIAPMGKYIDLPMILETLPEDFRTPEEFWDHKKYWD